MSNDQIRSLASLDNVISSSRVLNLNKIYKLHRTSPAHREKPLFSNAQLNKAIILKHRLRLSERSAFSNERSVATKILFPIDTMELKLGAQYVFVGQKNFEDQISEILRDKISNLGGDIAILNLLDSIPSLDSYLLRQFLNRGGIKPANCYFENGIADRKFVEQFILNEISTLVKMSFGSDGTDEKSRALIEKLLSPEAAEATDELRVALQMEKAAYRQGIFFWRAVLFYKWQIKKMAPLSGKVFREIRRTRALEFTKKDERDKIEYMRNAIAYKFSLICAEVDDVLYIYDNAYNSFILNGDHVEFKKFLISSPLLFKKLGESFNDMAHIVNFWKFRPKRGHSVAITLAHLSETLLELESMPISKSA